MKKRRDLQFLLFYFIFDNFLILKFFNDEIHKFGIETENLVDV